MRRLAVLMMIAIAFGGCAGEKEEADEPGLSGTCGLRKIARDVDESRVSEEFVLEGVEIAKTADLKGRFIATINAPYTVNDAYRAYLRQVKEAGWEIVNHETEGFEAEIYLTDPMRLAAVQVRTSTCERKVVVYVSIVDRSEAGGG
jgi:hypothetical protein